jgi:predicted DNA-binding protein with PD1-like motif
MRRTMVLLSLLALGGPVFAQRTKRMVDMPTTPAEDSKPNSDSVPNVYATSGQFQRIVILRVKNKADLLASLEQGVREQKIRNAVILSGIGSLRNYHIHVVGNATFPSKNLYVKDPDAPVDMVSMNGYVIGGRIHTHVDLADGDHSFGGHLEPGTSVFTFAIVTLGVLPDDLDLSRLDDKNYR